MPIGHLTSSGYKRMKNIEEVNRKFEVKSLLDIRYNDFKHLVENQILEEQNDTNANSKDLEHEKRQTLAFATVEMLSAITGAMGNILFGDNVNVETIEKELKEAKVEIVEMSEKVVNLEKSQVSLNEKFAAQISENARTLVKTLTDMNIREAKTEAYELVYDFVL